MTIRSLLRSTILASPLLALVAGSAMAQTPAANVLGRLTPVTDDMLKNPSPNDWLMIRGNYKGWSHSQLNQINKQNVKGLQIGRAHV